MIFDYASFFKTIKQSHIEGADHLAELANKKLVEANHGDFAEWLGELKALPSMQASVSRFDCPAVQIGKAADLVSDERLFFEERLKKFHPWRKGPFELFGVLIDAEWKSSLKWDRIIRCIQPLEGRTVLDLGCGNGYYLWRMLGQGARLALGIDPSLLFNVQFQVFQKYAQDSRLALLPLGVEDLPRGLTGWDTVFSMGLLYHRRYPLEHLRQIKALLHEEGELVLETLVIDGARGDLLKPGEERYAKMRNVWNVPAPETVELWLEQAGFKDIQCADISVTTTMEQRKTEWMRFESLEDFLDPRDPSRTVEGHPAPKRAIFTASK